MTRVPGACRGGRLCGGLGRLDSSHPVEACDSMHTDLGHRLLRAVTADETARLDLADELEVGALGERGGVFGCPAKHHAPMPSGLRLALSRLAVLPGPLC